MTFEDKLAQLEKIIEKLENEQIGLDESVKIYQEAKKLSEELTNEINEATKKLSYIVENNIFTPIDTNDIKKDI